ncbi:hypothetical protein M2132_000727 [Dysgonomonas sp. PH5-45]|uniref:M23 family metallopeptidase n=1 Tax=unclassified Dysgonomonas TaxID=2630389 RepID=UPI002473C19F|nr:MULTISPECIES: M23 family metallopeptidase [unclassified Dysgonomonas]MDH6354399.1 hypothetical protein [Dysgonomonas sp. PH5-45]MDH6387298.1 hypothetical protein [Dysgonomonas sp. PH5-37]
MRKLCTILFALSLIMTNNISFAQNYRSPLDIPLLLSANCGELRNNHFHTGVDFKTQGVVNKPIYAVADGYVSRINVSPSGYGLALYIDHPSTGHTSVYGHLNSFAPEIAQYIKAEQYKRESFRVDLYLKANPIKVKKGDIVAYSGNTGSSGGPHLHFEIRDSKTEKILDPLQYYKHLIKDVASPEIRGIAVFPVEGKGCVNNSVRQLKQSVGKTKKGEHLPLKMPIEAWGTIGFGVKAYDRMSGTSNIYGVQAVKLFVDGKEVFCSELQSFSFDQNRMLNSFVDFESWRRGKEFYMKSFVEPGNKLPFYRSGSGGYVSINEEREYPCYYLISDYYGNQTRYDFSIQGKKQTIASPAQCATPMFWNKINRYEGKTFSLKIPLGNLYSDLCFDLRQQASDKYLSDVYRVNNRPVALDKNAEMRIQITKSIADASKYGIVQLKNGKMSWIGGKYDGGYMRASIREFGDEYAVYYDDTPPKIEPVAEKKWVAQKSIKVRLSDNLSGVKSFRGTIDGRFVLFTHDVKSTVYTYIFDDIMAQTNTNHQFVFVAEDACGNITEYRSEFYY